MEAVINKYQGGKIYTIRSPHTEKYYIGSTIEKYLSSRFNGHNQGYNSFLNGNGNNITSFEIIKLGDAYIELLELFPCNSKLELCKREGELIREHKLNCINRKIEGRTKVEWRIDNDDKIKNNKKLDYIKNKTKFIQRSKNRYAENRDKMKGQHTKYYEDNKDKINEKRKISYEINKKLINEKRKEKYICQCGIQSTIAHRLRHNQSKIHQDYNKNLLNPL